MSLHQYKVKGRSEKGGGLPWAARCALFRMLFTLRLLRSVLLSFKGCAHGECQGDRLVARSGRLCDFHNKMQTEQLMDRYSVEGEPLDC